VDILPDRRAILRSAFDLDHVLQTPSADPIGKIRGAEIADHKVSQSIPFPKAHSAHRPTFSRPEKVKYFPNKLPWQGGQLPAVENDGASGAWPLYPRQLLACDAFSDSKYLRGLVCYSAENRDNRGVVLLSQLWDQFMTNPISGVATIEVCAVHAIRLTFGDEKLQDFTPRNVEKGSDQLDVRLQCPPWCDSAQPLKASTPKQPEQDSFGLVVSGMACRNKWDSSVERNVCQPSVPNATRCGFQVALFSVGR
jgi:hypothetical protein